MKSEIASRETYFVKMLNSPRGVLFFAGTYKVGKDSISSGD
jgi:hypothetical protein